MDVQTANKVRQLQIFSNQQVTEFSNMQRIIRQWYGNVAFLNWSIARIKELSISAMEENEYKEWAELENKYNKFNKIYQPVYQCWLRTLREITILVVELGDVEYE